MIAKERGIKSLIPISYQVLNSGQSFYKDMRNRSRRASNSLREPFFVWEKSPVEGRITEIEGIPIEAIASGHLIITHSQDVPGVIGDSSEPAWEHKE